MEVLYTIIQNGNRSKTSAKTQNMWAKGSGICRFQIYKCIGHKLCESKID